MMLRLRNSWKYQGDDRWDWRVFLEDDGSGDIDQIESVEYILHPSFPKPRMIRTDRDTKFELKTNGWGVFLIRAFAKTLDGKKIRLEHYLQLSYDPEEGETE
ncbi:MAG: pYEATS domain-containing protein [Bacteroidota bacterium]